MKCALSVSYSQDCVHQRSTYLLFEMGRTSNSPYGAEFIFELELALLVLIYELLIAAPLKTVATIPSYVCLSNFVLAVTLGI